MKVKKLTDVGDGQCRDSHHPYQFPTDLFNQYRPASTQILPVCSRSFATKLFIPLNILRRFSEQFRAPACELARCSLTAPRLTPQLPGVGAPAWPVCGCWRRGRCTTCPSGRWRACSTSTTTSRRSATAACSQVSRPDTLPGPRGQSADGGGGDGAQG